MTNRELLVKACRQTELPFPKTEYRRRLRNILRSMELRDIDLLFLSSPESMYYVCGYRAEWYQGRSPPEWPPTSGIAIHRGDERFILFDIDDEELMVRSETVAADIRIYWESPRPMTAWIVEELGKERWIPGRVGLEMRSYRPNRVVSEQFQKALESEGCEVVDCTDLVDGLRAVKSRAELACVREAARIADIGMLAAMEFMEPGITELQVYGEIIRAMADAGGENPGITIPVISGPRSARGHALASTRKLRKGEFVNIDVSGVFKRYHSNLARTFSLGKPEPGARELVEVSVRAFALLRKLIHPGMRVRDLVEAMDSFYHESGVYQELLWYGGYDLGIGFPPDWVGTYPYDRGNCRPGQVFVPGTVVNFESNFYLPRRAGASLLINTIIFEDKRAQVLGKIPDDLIVI